MKSNTKRNMTIVITGLLIAALLIPISASARMGGGQRGMGGGHMGKGLGICGIWRNTELVKELKLTDEQTQTLKDMDFAVREKMIDMKSKMGALMLEMEKAYAADTKDEALIIDLTKKMSDLRGEMSVARVQNRLAAEKVLSAEQLELLKTKMPFAHGKGRHGRKGHMMGGHGMQGGKGVYGQMGMNRPCMQSEAPASMEE